MKCRVCRGPAVIDVRRHNAAFCGDHFVVHCREQVQRAIRAHRMFEPEDRVLVAVSGGKDSLALWDLLGELGIAADGLILGLGIGDYSDASVGFAREYARDRGLAAPRGRARGRRRFHGPERRGGDAARAVLRLRALEAAPLQRLRTRARVHGGRDRPQSRRRSGGPPRQRAALGCRVPRSPAARPACDARIRAEGEATHPARRARDGGVLRAPRYRLPGRGVSDGRRATATWATRQILNELEDRSPGTKAAFLFGFLERGHERFADRVDARTRRSHACTSCGAPTPGDVCAFCRLRERAVAVPIDVARPRGRVAPWIGRSQPATGCCSSTPSGDGISSSSKPAVSSTRTPACSATTTSSVGPKA